MIWEFSHISSLSCTTPQLHNCCCALCRSAGARSARALIAPSPPAAATVVRTYQDPLRAGPLLLQHGRGRLARVFLPALIGGGRARAGNVSTSLFCKNLRSPGLAPAEPSRAEFELCYFMSEYPQQPEHCQSCFFSVFHFLINNLC